MQGPDNDEQQQIMESQFAFDQQVQPKLNELQLTVASANQGQLVRISLIPPEDNSAFFDPKLHQAMTTKRIPNDIMCVLDISGSMDQEAQVKNKEGQKESFGLSYLDVLKHAVKTTIMNMNEHDRFGLVSFSDAPRLEFQLSYMTQANKALAEVALENLQTEGSTNICGGLTEALDEMRKNQSDLGRHQSVILLTDGEPNIFPPSGHIPFLQKYFKKYEGFRPTINTFALGKFMDSKLLDDIACEGKGQYSFIPCPGFMGTIFVNCLSNILSTFGSKAEICIELLNGVKIGQVLGGVEHQIGANNKVLVSCGDIKFGQNRDFVFMMKYPQGFKNTMPFMNVNFKYHDYNMKKVKYLQQNEVMLDLLNMDDPWTVAQACRLNLVTRVKNAVETMKKGHWDEAKEIIRTLGQEFDHMNKEMLNHLSQIENNDHKLNEIQRYKDSSTYLSALIKDVEGEIRLSFLKEEWFKQWGRHFLPSLCHAHLKQQCNNFADPGIQGYGGQLFNLLKDEAEGTFLKLPPPKPSRKDFLEKQQAKLQLQIQPQGQQQQQQQQVREPSPVDMEKYYNGGGGCFHGDCLVKMADGTQKWIKDVLRGDLMYAGGIQHQKGVKIAKVECVVRIEKGNGALPFGLVELPNGLKISPKHPVFFNGMWQKPIDIGKVSCFSNELYNFVLEDIHCIEVNGIICTTFGHELKHEKCKHDYFGTKKIVCDLKQVKGYVNGLVSLQANDFVRNIESGQVNGIIQSLC